MTQETLQYDDQIRQTHPVLVGCDEVGRGCLAGPIVTAAVVLPAGVDIEGVMDSKKTRKCDHELLAHRIFDIALEIQMGVKSPAEIDKVGILEADREAMRDSINQLHVKPDMILIDGDRRQLLGTPYEERTLVKGDAHSLTIGAASIIAKYVRDRLMSDYDNQYPGYGFAKNAGYGTQQHRDALARLGITPIHRLTFEPIKSHINLWPKNNGQGGGIYD